MAFDFARLAERYGRTGCVSDFWVGVKADAKEKRLDLALATLRRHPNRLSWTIWVIEACRSREKSTRTALPTGNAPDFPENSQAVAHAGLVRQLIYPSDSNPQKRQLEAAQGPLRTLPDVFYPLTLAFIFCEGVLESEHRCEASEYLMIRARFMLRLYRLLHKVSVGIMAGCTNVVTL